MPTFILLLICTAIGAAIGHFANHTTQAVVVGAILGFVVGCTLRWGKSDGSSSSCMCDVFDDD
jgi:membrane protease YdiL (CAAX protease family)